VMMLPQPDSCAYPPKTRWTCCSCTTRWLCGGPVPHILVLRKARVAGAAWQDKTPAARAHECAKVEMSIGSETILHVRTGADAHSSVVEQVQR